MRKSQLLDQVRERVDKPFEEKIERANQLIKTFINLPRSNPCVSCSFGKDSVVVVYLVRKFKPDIPVIFNNTLVQHPETYEFRDKLVKEWNLNLIETKPIKTFWEVADEKGLDDGIKNRDACCDYLKEIPIRNLIKERGFTHNFTGMTVMESRVRMWNICQRGQYYYSRKDGIFRIHPIAFWTEKEVWSFIKDNDIPYNPIYDKGIKRSGCMTCTSFKGWKKRMAKYYPRIYKKIQEKYFGQKLLRK